MQRGRLITIIVLSLMLGCSVAVARTSETAATVMALMWGIPIGLIVVVGCLLWGFGVFDGEEPTNQPRSRPPSEHPRRRMRPDDDLKNRLYSNQLGRCAACEQRYSLSALQMDHVVPVARGGSDGPDNFQLLCGRCNRLKGAGTHRELLDELRRRGII